MDCPMQVEVPDSIFVLQSKAPPPPPKTIRLLYSSAAFCMKNRSPCTRPLIYGLMTDLLDRPYRNYLILVLGVTETWILRPVLQCTTHYFLSWVITNFTEAKQCNLINGEILSYPDSTMIPSTTWIQFYCFPPFPFDNLITSLASISLSCF